MAKNSKNTYRKNKSAALRIFIVLIAATLVAGIIIPSIKSNADDSESLTVQSFETGKLADALSQAADGTDYNFIKNVAVLSGTLSAQDYTALTAIPNLEILELAGCMTENGIIPENALPSRNQLSLITLPGNTVEIGANAFSGNQKLVKVTMPSTVVKISDYAFAYCEKLESIPVSESVSYIGEGAFKDCKAIGEFVIPAGITELYPNTFSKCGFEKISIGPNVAKIDESVFADCNALKDIYVYGKTAPALGNDVFRNVSASVHCYEDSEESYKSWAQNNITIAADLTGEYSLKADVPSENGDIYPETSAPSAPENTSAETSSDPDAAAADAPAQSRTEGLSVGIVIVIVVMAMIIAVLATILIMNSKKKA